LTTFNRSPIRKISLHLIDISRAWNATVDLPVAIVRTWTLRTTFHRVASKEPGLVHGAMAEGAEPPMHLEIENRLGYLVISAGKAATHERNASLHIKPKGWSADLASAPRQLESLRNKFPRVERKKAQQAV
jgi:hypothetical protein